MSNSYVIQHKIAAAEDQVCDIFVSPHEKTDPGNIFSRVRRDAVNSLLNKAATC